MLDYDIPPEKIRLVPKPSDTYRWRVFTGKEHLFHDPQISNFGKRKCQLMIDEIGKGFSAEKNLTVRLATIPLPVPGLHSSSVDAGWQGPYDESIMKYRNQLHDLLGDLQRHATSREAERDHSKTAGAGGDILQQRAEGQTPRASDSMSSGFGGQCPASRLVQDDMDLNIREAIAAAEATASAVGMYAFRS